MDIARTRARANSTPVRNKAMRSQSRPPRRTGHAAGRSRPASLVAPSDGAAPDRARERELLALQILRARHRAS